MSGFLFDQPLGEKSSTELPSTHHQPHRPTIFVNNKVSPSVNFILYNGQIFGECNGYVVIFCVEDIMALIWTNELTSLTFFYLTKQSRSSARAPAPAARSAPPPARHAPPPAPAPAPAPHAPAPSSGGGGMLSGKMSTHLFSPNRFKSS